MQNPFLKLAIGIPGDIGKMSKAGINAEITHYSFLDCWFHHGPGHLLIAGKDQFPDMESAFIGMLLRVIHNENDICKGNHKSLEFTRILVLL